MKKYFLATLVLPFAVSAFADTAAKTKNTTTPAVTGTGTNMMAAVDFNVADNTGKMHKLGDYKGKYVVLEWYNKDCPYVRKHYDTKNMQELQKKYTGKGVAWLTVNSSATGTQGFIASKDIAAQITKEGAAATAYLVDTDGKMGKAYGAKTTPHMYIINPEGQLIYSGAIDSDNSANKASVKTATNYVSTVLDTAMAGKPVTQRSTASYGCSVKYN